RSASGGRMHTADRLFSWLIWMCAALVVSALLWVLGDVVMEGWSHFSWRFLIDEPQDTGRTGGIGPILVSTLWILLIALSAALPLGLGVAIWLSEFAPRQSRFADGTGITLDIL